MFTRVLVPVFLSASLSIISFVIEPPIKKHIANEWKQRFEELNKEFTEDDHPDFLYYVGPVVDVEIQKPITKEELASLDMDSFWQQAMDAQQGDRVKRREYHPLREIMLFNQSGCFIRQRIE